MHTQALTDDGQLDMLHGHWLLFCQGAMFSVESVRLFVRLSVNITQKIMN